MSGYCKRKDFLLLHQFKFVLHRFNARVSFLVILLEYHGNADSFVFVFVLAVEHHIEAAFLAGGKYAAWKIDPRAFAGIYDVDLHVFAGRIGEFKKSSALFTFFYRAEVDHFFIPGDKCCRFGGSRRGRGDGLGCLSRVAGEKGEKGEDGE